VHTVFDRRRKGAPGDLHDRGPRRARDQPLVEGEEVVIRKLEPSLRQVCGYSPMRQCPANQNTDTATQLPWARTTRSTTPRSPRTSSPTSLPRSSRSISSRSRSGSASRYGSQRPVCTTS
jgi:hypothetical protein